VCGYAWCVACQPGSTHDKAQNQHESINKILTWLTDFELQNTHTAEESMMAVPMVKVHVFH
jgi:hypothetical protein